MRNRISLLFLLSFLFLSLSHAQEASSTSGTLGDTVSLGESVVKKERVMRSGQKDVILITKSMRRGAYDTKMMLNKAPGFSYNIVNKTLSYQGNKNLVVLVDSVEKDLSHILNLHHLRFEKIEVIHHPMGKYANYDAIINLHTKKDYTGYEHVFNAYATYHPTDGNGVGKHWREKGIETTFAYTKNKWNVLMMYSGDLSGGDREVHTEKRFLHHNYQEIDIDQPSGKRPKSIAEGEHMGGGSVDYQINKRHSLSLQVGTEYKCNTAHTDKLSLVSDLAMSYADTLAIQQQEKDRGWRSGIGLFYRGGTGAWHYNATFNYIVRDWDYDYLKRKSSGFHQENNTHRNMGHTWLQADVNRRFLSEKLYWSLTYNHFWRRYRQSWAQSGVLLNQNTLRYHDLSSYLSYDLSKNLSLYASLGMKQSAVDYLQAQDHYWDVYGKAGVFARFSKLFWSRIDYSCSMKNPSLDQTTRHGYYTDTLIWQTGNPQLRSSLEHSLRLKLNALEFVTLSLDLSHSPRDLNQISELQTIGNTPHIVRSPQNGKYTRALARFNMNASNPLFLCELNLAYNYQKAEYAHNKQSRGGWVGDVQLGYEFNKLQTTCYLNYQWGKDHSTYPQEYSIIETDRLTLSVRKQLCKGALIMEFRYSLPLSLSAQHNTIGITTPFYQEINVYPQKDQLTNFFVFAFAYRLHGGKSVRQYKKEMSQEY